MRLPLTTRYPLLCPVRVRQRQLARRLRWALGGEVFAREKSPEWLACKVYRHQSKLRRYFSTDPQDKLWQDNKVHNHALALPHLDGEIRCENRLPHRFRIVERNAGFEKSGDVRVRHNEIWRETIAKEKGRAVLDATFLYANRVRAMYEPQG